MRENEITGIVSQKNEAFLGKSVVYENVEKLSKSHQFDNDKIFEHIENSDEVQENDHEKSSNNKKELIDNEWYTFISNEEVPDAEKENEVENVTIGTKLIHTENMSYECKTCQKRFTTKQQLKIHERIHTGEVPYECKTCKKRFKQITNLKRHEIIHTGEKPYECQNCKKRFSRSDKLKSHERQCWQFEPKL